MTTDLPVWCPRCLEGFTVDAEGYEELSPHKPFCPDCIPDLIPLLMEEELALYRKRYSSGASVMTKDEIKKLKALAARGWHAAELYTRGDGQIAMTTPRGHPLAPSVARLLEERERLLEALRALRGLMDSPKSAAIYIDRAITLAEAPASKEPPTPPAP